MQISDLIMFKIHWYFTWDSNLWDWLPCTFFFFWDKIWFDFKILLSFCLVKVGKSIVGLSWWGKKQCIDAVREEEVKGNCDTITSIPSLIVPYLVLIFQGKLKHKMGSWTREVIYTQTRRLCCETVAMHLCVEHSAVLFLESMTVSWHHS